MVHKMYKYGELLITKRDDLTANLWKKFTFFYHNGVCVFTDYGDCEMNKYHASFCSFRVYWKNHFIHDCQRVAGEPKHYVHKTVMYNSSWDGEKFRWMHWWLIHEFPLNRHLVLSSFVHEHYELTTCHAEWGRMTHAPFQVLTAAVDIVFLNCRYDEDYACTGNWPLIAGNLSYNGHLLLFHMIGNIVWSKHWKTKSI